MLIVEDLSRSLQQCESGASCPVLYRMVALKRRDEIARGILVTLFASDKGFVSLIGAHHTAVTTRCR